MKLNTKRTVLIGFAFMSILCFWQFYDQVIPFVLENIFGIKTFAANAIMSIDNVLAIFMLPLFGAISDKTRTRLGKRTPYILFGTIAAVVCMCFMAFMQQSKNLWGFLVALFLILVVMAVYRSPAVAYMPDITEKPLRSKANAIINLVGYIGGIFAMVVMMFLLKSEKRPDGSSVYSEDQSFIPVYLIVAAFMLISVLIMVFTVRENKVLAETNISDEEEKAVSGGKLPRPVLKSLIFILLSVFLWFMAYNAVTTAFSRYCVAVWGADLSVSSGYLLVATASAIVSFVPLGFVSGKLGRKKTILLGIALMTVCYLSAVFMKEKTPIMYPLFGLVGIGWAAINVNSFPMVVEMSNGADVGKYTGIYYAFSMAAQIATPLLSGLLIDTLGLGYTILFPYAVLFSSLAFITMLFVRHGDSKPIGKEAALQNLGGEA